MQFVFSAATIDQTPRLLFFVWLVLVWLLFEGTIYFVGKPADTIGPVLIA